MAISQVNLTTRLTLDESATVSDARIVLGAVAPTPIRAPAAEGILTGKQLSDELLEQAAGQAGQEISAIADVRASQAYREQMVEVLVRRALRATRDELGRKASSG
jgi:carbon-monoxide dehydrogenase medium subunit